MDLPRQDAPTENQPVTYIIRRRVKSGCLTEFERWLAGINQAALTFDGHLGANVIRPADAATSDYVIIWRFDSYANLRKWEDSSVRKDWLDRSWHLSVGRPTVQKLTGLDFWFTAPHGATAPVPPPKHKMAVIVIVALYPLLITLHVLLGPIYALFPFPYFVQVLVTVIIAVLIMTFFLMPLMTRLFARWLYSR